MPILTHQQDELLWLSSTLLEAQPHLRHGFSTRKGGVSQPPWYSLNLGIGRDDNPEHVRENYRRFCGALGMDHRRVVLTYQTHTTNIRRVTPQDAGKGLWQDRDYRDVDGFITNEKNLPLVVFSADCGIILLYDPVQHAAGALHAGWRGCAGGIPETAVKAMTASFGSRPSDILAAIGPGIGQCCFETDADVPMAMEAALGTDALPYTEKRGPKFYVDLPGLNRQWLLRAGLLPEHIEVSDLCTACHPELFWSHRKMGNTRGAQVAMISLD